MEKPLEQHQIEIERNKELWGSKPLIRRIYADFYRLIIQELNPSLGGSIVELGSGLGNLKSYLPAAISTDLFPNPWLDLACDAYRLPFASGAVSNLILFDVFHHLARPVAFIREAQRVLEKAGRLVLFEPYISVASWPAYGWFHHEPIGWRETIEMQPEAPKELGYYAAQGNATRLFFAQEGAWLPSGWRVLGAKRFSSLAYLLSGGLSKPSLYPEGLYPAIKRMDSAFSKLSGILAGRCLVVLTRD